MLFDPKVKRLFEAVCYLPADERDDVLSQTDPTLRQAVLDLLTLAGEAEGLCHTDGGAGWMRQAVKPNVLPEQLSGFRVIRRLGAGAMGVVYEVEQSHPKRRIALKLLHPHVQRPSVLKLFRFQAQALAQVVDPGLPTLYEAGETDDGEVYLAMELVAGPTLTEWARQRRISLRDRVGVLAQISDAVSAAHAAGVLHRDLKPANIVVTERGPKVLGFGVAAPFAEIAQGRQPGTPAYMSPEALAQEPIDARTDVYALACIAHELLTGALPDRSYSNIAMSRLPTDMAAALQRGLAVDRALRCPSASAFAEDLRRAEAGLSLTWRPDFGYQARWFDPRSQRGIAVIAALIVGVLALSLTPNAIRQIQEHLRRGRATDNLPRLERALEGVDADERQRAFTMVRTFAQAPSNRSTPAESKAWLLLAARLQALEMDGVRDALAEAYLSAEDPAESQISLARHFSATAAWDSLWILRQRLDEPTREALADELHSAAVAKRLFAEATAQSADRLLTELSHAQDLGINAHKGTLADLDQDGTMDVITIEPDVIRAVPIGERTPYWSGQPHNTTAWTTGKNLLFHDGQYWFANGNQHSAELYSVQVGQQPPLRTVGQFEPSNVRTMVSTSLNGESQFLVARAYPTRSLTLVDTATGQAQPAISDIERLDSDPMDVVAADLDGDGRDELLVAMGAWTAYDLRVYRATADGWTLHSRLSTGTLGQIVVVPRPGQSPLIVAGKNNLDANLRVFPPESPYGPAPGVYAWTWSHEGLTAESFWAPPVPDLYNSILRIESPLLGDFDGDGTTDLAWTLKDIHPDVEELLWIQSDILGETQDYVLGGLEGLAALDVDDDGDAELLVGDENERLWLLGTGDGMLPPNTTAFTLADPIGDAPTSSPITQRLWSRADDLVGVGLVAEAANALVLAPDLANDPETIRAAHAAAAVLLESAGKPIDAAHQYARAVELGDEASRAGLIRTRLYILDLPGATEYRRPGVSPKWLTDITAPSELDLLSDNLHAWQLARPGTLRLRDGTIEADIMNDEGVIARMPVTVTDPWVQLELHALVDSLELGSGLALSLERDGEPQLMVGIWSQGGGGVLKLHQQCGHAEPEHLAAPIISLKRPNRVWLRAARNGLSSKTRCFNSHNGSQQWREYSTSGIALGPAELVLRAHGDADYSPPTRARIRLEDMRAMGVAVRSADLVEQAESVRLLFDGDLVGSPHPRVAVEWALASADTQAIRRALASAPRQELRWHLRRHGAATAAIIQDLYPDEFAEMYRQALREACSDLAQSEIQEALLRPELDTLDATEPAGRFLRVRRAEVHLLRRERATARSIAQSVTTVGSTDQPTVDAWLVLARLDAARQDLARAHIDQAIALNNNGQAVWNRIARYPEFQDNPITPAP